MNKLACLFILFAIIGSSCEKDKNTDDVYICYDETNPACANYDPCHNKEEPTADFGIYDKVYNLNSYSFIEEDSNLIGNSIRFKPKYSSFNISHTWYLGNEVINDSTVEREFTNVPRPYNIEVTHVIEFPVDSNCYPNATGKDSISRTFSLASEFSDLETTGEFNLINDITKESFNIKVEVVGIQQNGLNDDTIYSVPVNPDERINQNINKVFGLLTNLKEQNKVYISLLSNSNSVCYIKDVRLKNDEDKKINSQYYFHKKQGSEYVLYEILNSDTINVFNTTKL